MSRIGNRPIPLSKAVNVTVDGSTVKVKGSKGEMSHSLPDTITCEVEETQLVVKRANNEREIKALHGLNRSLLQNMVTGCDVGFKKELLIQGVGYRAQVKGKTLVLNIGYSHPVEYAFPEGVSISVTDNIRIAVEGYDKQVVGQVAAIIRDFRAPEPYKGKGIRYADEQLRRKEGKTV